MLKLGFLELTHYLSNPTEALEPMVLGQEKIQLQAKRLT